MLTFRIFTSVLSIIYLLFKEETMKSTSYTLIQEPAQQVYYHILEYALKQVQIGLFVVRPDMPLSTQGTNLIEELKPFIQKQIVSDEWPGTRLLTGNAIVYYFVYNRETLAILKKASDRLYQWLQPDLPEDLCLLKSYNKPWLVSISHEKDAYFILDEAEFSSLVIDIPELGNRLSKDMC